MPAIWKNTVPAQTLRKNVEDRFYTSFGEAPYGVYSAPGRVNLLGEHIDYCGGTVLPFALPQRTFVAMTPRQDGKITAVTAQGDAGSTAPDNNTETVQFAEVGTQPLSGWLSYVAGVPWAMQQQKQGDFAGFSPEGFGANIAIDSSVPLGAGLSSSAALECAVALGVDDLLTAQQPTRELLASTDQGRAALASACIQAENDIAGASTGGMDQSISLRAEEGSVLAIDCRDFSTRPLTIDVASANLSVLVIDTRAYHNLSDGQYAARRAATEVAREALGVNYLRDAFQGTPTLKEAQELIEQWDNNVDSYNLPDGTDRAVIRDALRHVWTEIARVEECIALFDNVNSPADDVWEKLGELLNASHDSLRDQYRVSCPELDTAVNAAREAGALGARMTGGGFGGSAIALVPTENLTNLAEAVAEAFDREGFNPPEFLVATPSRSAEKE
ncbi:galactokinase [Rothia nasimurium]|uniref:galactokinase n=1 Tax=Rothia nasimurium TaxID=85336 RepID=UPI001F0128C1|nr:galactokinase [Rothia nasimurium]